MVPNLVEEMLTTMHSCSLLSLKALEFGKTLIILTKPHHSLPCEAVFVFVVLDTALLYSFVQQDQNLPLESTIVFPL